jgi:hypothetical protein
MEFSRRDILLATSAAGLGWFIPGCAFGQSAPKKLPIGMNLAGIADWESGFPFRDLMRGARAWMTRNASGESPWNTNMFGSIKLDPNGYPLEVPAKVPNAVDQAVFTLIANTRPGKYVALWDGDGDLEFILGARAGASAKNRAEVTIAPRAESEYAGVVIRRSQTGNNVRSLRIVPIADEKVDLAKIPFHDEFLAFAKQWHALRFMDWTVTNNSQQRTWSGRRKLPFYTWVGAGADAEKRFGPGPSPEDRMLSGGIPWEICLHAANVAKADAWICVPHLADDDYIENLAKLVKATLDPKLKVYVEFSNEIWNWQFMQAHFMLNTSSVAPVLKQAGIDAWENESERKGTNHPERTGALFRRNFEIWERVFSGPDRKRLVRVCAVQFGWYDTAARTVDFVMKHGGCDALSPAGYIGPNDAIFAKWEAAGASLTADQVLEHLTSELQQEKESIAKYRALAKKHGIRYIVYEGGQHIQPKGQAETNYMPALGLAQRHPGMATLYKALLEAHADAGVDLFTAFSSISAQGTRWGSWGAAPAYNTPLSEAPKLRALIESNLAKV